MIIILNIYFFLLKNKNNNILCLRIEYVNRTQTPYTYSTTVCMYSKVINNKAVVNKH